MAQLRLTTLGRSDLTGVAGGVILPVQSQPKRFALLIYPAADRKEVTVTRGDEEVGVHPTLLDCELQARLRR